MKGASVVGARRLHPALKAGIVQGLFPKETDAEIDPVEIGATAVIRSSFCRRLAGFNGARDCGDQVRQLIFFHACIPRPPLTGRHVGGLGLVAAEAVDVFGEIVEVEVGLPGALLR